MSVAATETTAKLKVSNDKSVPHVVSVEPWGADFTLLPGEQFEIEAFGEAAGPWFELVEHPDETVFCNDASTYEVKQNGSVLLCGHHRQPPSKL